MIIGRLQNRKGFTITETVVSILLFAMLGSAMISLVIHCIRGWSSGNSNISADNSLHVALNKLSQDVREGSAATVVGNELKVTIPQLITDAYSEEYYVVGGTSKTYQYYLSGNTLYRKIDTGTAVPFARGISSVTFSVTQTTVLVTFTSVD
ncbi:MAG TPA: hypothetical protein PLP86_08370, partial [Armatimonadota bacterium]|nr:hypothetical protein [Armatimonadota bacterium]